MLIVNKMKWGLTALLVSAILTGCNGDDGAPGQDGATGQPGEQGLQGGQGPAGQDASLGITLSPVARVLLNNPIDDGAEIVQYHSATHTIYATNTSADAIAIIDASTIGSEALADPVNDVNLTATEIALPTEANSVALGGANSIAVWGDWMAVSMEADDKQANGYVLFYNGLDVTAPSFVKAVEVGALPDMVTFTPDGSKVIVANEGEPSGDYSNDPEGSLSVINIGADGPADSAQVVTFTSFNGVKMELMAQGMHFPNPDATPYGTTNGIVTSVAQDLEPEYITTSNEFAYVTLQENNGLAILDLSDLSVQIIGLGYKDWQGLNIDAIEDGAVSFAQYEGLYGVYMPDTIDHYEWKGAPFLVTANEGDAREYLFDTADEASCLATGAMEFDEDDGCLAYTDEAKIKDLTAEAGSFVEALQNTDADGLRVTRALGDGDNDGEYDTAYAYGARSFTIWDQNGLVVFDSGDDFERITASVHGAAFNNTDDENASDDRSENKGPEPEALTIGQVGERTYAFIGLERMGGIMVYDITNPYDATFVDYIVNRDTTEGLEVKEGDTLGDLAPESLVFVPAENSVNQSPLLIVGNEVSGSVTVWRISQK